MHFSNTEYIHKAVRALVTPDSRTLSSFPGQTPHPWSSLHSLSPPAPEKHPSAVGLSGVTYASLFHRNASTHQVALCVQLLSLGMRSTSARTAAPVSTPFRYSPVIFHCTDMHLAYPFIQWRTAGLFPPSGNWDYCLVHCCARFYLYTCFQFFRFTPSIDIAGFHTSSVYSWEKTVWLPF